MKWCGSFVNRLEENKQFVEEIKVGTGVTEYFYTDREAYEVVEVVDQKHVSIRKYDHKKIGTQGFDNDWELIPNENNPILDIVKRGKYWYRKAICTPTDAKEIKESDNIDWKLWACHNRFDLDGIIAKNKTQTTYDRLNISFGKAEYYYDYSF